MKANYLASPPLVVAYALAGTTDIDLSTQPLGTDTDGNPVLLSEIWPSQAEIAEAIAGSMSPEMYIQRYGASADGPPEWQAITGAEGDVFDWDAQSTYVQEPPFFVDMPADPPPIESIHAARVIISVNDSVNTAPAPPATGPPRAPTCLASAR